MNIIHRKMAAGAVWMIALKVADNGLGLISTVVLARLLLPSDFGALAMAMSVIALFELMSAFRFDMAIIQRQSVTREHLDTAWTFNVAFGVAVGLLTYLSAGPAAEFYREPRLEGILQALSIGWVAFGLENIGTVAFRKELQFDKEFMFSLSKRLAMFAVTIPLAFMLKSYWALVIGIIVGKVASVVISFIVHPYRPRFSIAGARDLFSFSTWLLLNNILYFINDRISNFAIGRISGARALGAYNIAYEISCLPTVELVAPINRAVYPGYAKLAGDGDGLHGTFVSTIGLLALAAFPAGVGIAAVAEPLVHVALGSQWLDAIPLVMILGIYGAIAALGTNTGYVFIAVGKPRLLTLLAGGRAAVLVPALIAGCQWKGAVGAALVVLALEFVFRPMTFWMALRVLQSGAGSLLGALWRPIVASAPMYLSVRWVQKVPLPLDGTLLHGAHLFLGVAVGVVVYSTVVWALWRASGSKGAAEAVVLERLKALLQRGRLSLA